MTIGYSDERTIQLKRGGSLTVRRPTRSAMTRLAKRVNYRRGDTGSEMEFEYLVVRASIVAGENIRDAKGNLVKFRLLKDPTLGEIVDERVVDVLADADGVEIGKALGSLVDQEGEDESAGN